MVQDSNSLRRYRSAAINSGKIAAQHDRTEGGNFQTTVVVTQRSAPARVPPHPPGVGGVV
ncbi:MAG: hypothetical protein WBD71_17080 [Xanthobacteraceae bacterium]